MATKNTKKQPNGYWHNYENNHNEAKKYKSRKEFQKSCSGAYNAARKNGWLDNYTWFIEKKKWDEKTCEQEAQKYKSRSEFKKGCKSVYNAARKNGWLSNYTWFIEKKKPSGYWTEKTCEQEAQKYKSRREFEKGCSGAYKVALKNGWLDNYTWFISTDELLKIKLTKWTEKTCNQEAQKYKSRKEFQKGCQSTYNAALKNGWLDKYTWFERDLNPYKNKRDNVYCYIFTELHSIYIGRTVDINRRNEQHNTNEKCGVYKFATQNNIPIPQITILESNLSLKEGLEKEDFYVNKYKEEGWNVLNKAKTGKNSGSLGTLNSGKWNKKTCEQEAQKYKSRREFEKVCKSAYNAALKNGWLDDYTWFISRNELQKINQTKWTKKTCYQEAKKYNSRNEFRKGCSRAYEVARQNGWLNNYTWFSVSKTGKKWDEKTCYQEAKKYKSRSEFKKGCSGAYEVARINCWLDDYFPKCN